MKIIYNKNKIWNISSVENVIRTTNKQDLAMIYCKKDLSNMFVTIFGGKPRANMKKDDVAHSIWNYFHVLDRASSIIGC